MSSPNGVPSAAPLFLLAKNLIAEVNACSPEKYYKLFPKKMQIWQMIFVCPPSIFLRQNRPSRRAQGLRPRLGMALMISRIDYKKRLC